MKQLVLKEQLSQGLRVFEDSVRNNGRAVELVNAVTCPVGLVPWKEVASDELTPAPTWPFPQMAQLHGDYYIFGESNIWRVDSYEGPEDILLDFDPGGQWHLAELENAIVGTNGVNIVVIHNADSCYAIDMAVTTLCSFRGRLVLGGVEGMLESWAEDYDVPSLSSRHVLWLPISGPGLMLVTNPTTYVDWWNLETGRSDTLAEVLGDIVERNELGWKELDSDIQRVLSVDSGVVAYCSKSVWAMMPMSGENPGFGTRRILNVGSGERGCAGGNTRQHIFVDESGRHWTVDGSFGVQTLYYDGLVVGEVVISQNEKDSSYYVADSSKTLVLTPSGMSEVRESISAMTSALNTEGYPYGYSYGITDDNFYYKTDVIDFGMEGMKTLHSVRLIYDSPNRMDVKVHYKDDVSGNFRSLGWQTVDALGVIDTPISSSAVYLELRNSSYIGLRLHEIKILFSESGKQNSKHTFKRVG